MLKSLLGIAPKSESDGSYSPSKVALKMATSDKTDFESVAYPKYQGNRSKILVICTEHKNMEMQNGKLFSTGNHPVETFVPMLHLKEAGFEFEIATPTGKPAVLEMWAFPEKDADVKVIYDEYQSQFENPKSLQDSDTAMPDPQTFAAVFVPGGHGAMLGLPDDENVAKALKWAHENNLFTITLCHGPAALLATTLNEQHFLYDGYKMAAFPDSMDEMSPKIGYLPGKVPWAMSEKLKNSGAIIVNSKADNTVCLDRTLITGASPQAANGLGKLAAETLLQTLI